MVESTQEGWWGLGGEAEKEAEDERRRKRVLLDTGSDAWKERKEEERKEGKETIKKAFGKGKVRCSKLYFQWEEKLTML